MGDMTAPSLRPDHAAEITAVVFWTTPLRLLIAHPKGLL